MHISCVNCRPRVSASITGGATTQLKPSYSPQEQAIWINKTQSFKPVPQAVWDFYIGGYQVLDKYLKSRKGRKLSFDELNRVAAVTNSLAFTIDQMGKIDSAYKEAFPDRGKVTVRRG
jgi:hypothetical protein